MTLRSTLTMVSGGALLGTVLATTPVCAEEPAEQRVVVHLGQGTNDLHAVQMALKLGAAMRARGATVTLLLDREGVRICDTRQPNDLRWGHGGTVAELMDAFTQAGGKALVCPHCGAAVGADVKSMRSGCQLATESAFADALLAADKVLDY